MQENENRDNTSYGERLKALIKAKGLNASRFSSMAGISNAAVSEAMRDPERTYREKTVAKILNTFPDVNPSWLRHGEGKMFLEPGQMVVNFRGGSAAQTQLTVNSGNAELSALKSENAELRKKLERKEDVIKAIKDQIDTLKLLVSVLEENQSGKIAS